MVYSIKTLMCSPQVLANSFLSSSHQVRAIDLILIYLFTYFISTPDPAGSCQVHTTYFNIYSFVVVVGGRVLETDPRAYTLALNSFLSFHILSLNIHIACYYA